ncbi:sperm flagellar protein 2 isoform X4 [Silurus meridionalis]|nr:sperm flagellar protein 2 isoform X4 [Silurus meridionalis]
MVDWRQFLLSAACPWPLPSQAQLRNTLAHFKEIDTEGGGVITLQQYLQDLSRVLEIQQSTSVEDPAGEIPSTPTPGEAPQ